MRPWISRLPPISRPISVADGRQFAQRHQRSEIAEVEFGQRLAFHAAPSPMRNSSVAC